MCTQITTRYLGKDSPCLQDIPFVHKDRICEPLAEIRRKRNSQWDSVRVYDQEMKQNYVIAAIEKQVLHIEIGHEEWIVWELKTKDIIGNNEIELYAIGEPNTRAESPYWQVVYDDQFQDSDGVCDFFVRKSGFVNGSNVSFNGDAVKTFDSFRKKIFDCLPASNRLQIDKSIFYPNDYNYYYDVEIVLDEEAIKTNLTSRSNEKKYKTLCHGMQRLGISDPKEFGNIIVRTLKRDMIPLVKNNPDWIEMQRYFNENEGKYGKVHDEFVLPLEIEGNNYVFKASIACKSQRDENDRIYRIVGTVVNTPWITMSNVALACRNGEVPIESWVSQMNDGTRSFFAQFKKQQYQHQHHEQPQAPFQQPLSAMQQQQIQQVQQVQHIQQQVNGQENGQNAREYQFGYINNNKNVNVNINGLNINNMNINGRSNSGTMTGAPLERGRVQFNANLNTQNLNHMIVNSMHNNTITTTNNHNNNNGYNPIFSKAQQGYSYQLQLRQHQLGQPLLFPHQYHQRQQSLGNTKQNSHTFLQLSQTPPQSWQQLAQPQQNMQPQQQQKCSMGTVMTNVHDNEKNCNVHPIGSNSNVVRTISSLNTFGKDSSSKMKKGDGKQIDKSRNSVKQKKKGCISSVTTNDSVKKEKVQGYDYRKAQANKKIAGAQCMSSSGGGSGSSGDVIDIKIDNSREFSRVGAQVEFESEQSLRDDGIVNLKQSNKRKIANKKKEETAEVDGAGSVILLSSSKKSQNRNGEDIIAVSSDVDEKDKKAGLKENRNYTMSICGNNRKRNERKTGAKSKSKLNENMNKEKKEEKEKEKERECEVIDDRESIDGDENKSMNDNSDGYLSDSNNYNTYNKSRKEKRLDGHGCDTVPFEKERKKKRGNSRIASESKNEEKFEYTPLTNGLKNGFGAINMNEDGDINGKIRFTNEYFQNVCILFSICDPNDDCGNISMNEIYYRTDRVNRNVILVRVCNNNINISKISVDLRYKYVSIYDKFWQWIYELNNQFRNECLRMRLANGKNDKSMDYWKKFNEKLNEIERKSQVYKKTQTVWCLLTKWFGEISIKS